MAVSFDVIENILTRSDVKDLLCFKSVCKSWYSLISNPYFTKAHLKHNICHSNNNDAGHTRIAIQIHDHRNLCRDTKWELVGSSNGLVCVSFSHLLKDDALIFLINPWTREVRELPMAPLLIKEATYEISLSFGHDSSTDDYKLVMGIKNKNGVVTLVQVLSLKSMTWKLIGHINYSLIYGKPSVLFNGAIHWFARDYNTKERQLVILSFNLSREEFGVIPVPGDSTYVVMLGTLGVFEDKLCISCTKNILYYEYYAIWVMRNYNVKESWEHLPNDYEMKSHDAIHYMKIYDCTSPKKKRMTCFCNYKPYLSRSWKDIISAPIYVQSLVSPYVNSERPSHTGSAKE